MSSFEQKGAKSTSTAAAATTAAAASTSAPTPHLPSANTLTHAARLAISEDKKIMMDYWVPSLEKKAFLGVRANNKTLIVKSADEYTSPIEKMYSPKTKTGEPGEETIFITANSIYIAASNLQRKRIT